MSRWKVKVKARITTFKLSSTLTYVFLVLQISVKSIANVSPTETQENSVIMFSGHLILTKMGTLILRNSSFQLMLHQLEHLWRNLSGLLGKGRNWTVHYLYLDPSTIRMYDVDGNGWIDLEEMTKLVGSIYKMLGQHQLVKHVSKSNYARKSIRKSVWNQS